MESIADVSLTQFGKLERVEIGGTRGRSLTATVKNIMNDFNKQMEIFQRVEYDVLMAPAEAFDSDFRLFQTAVSKLERRLGAVIVKVSRSHSRRLSQMMIGL